MDRKNDETFARSIDGLILGIECNKPRESSRRDRVRMPKSPSHRELLTVSKPGEAQSEKALKLEAFDAVNISNRYASSSISSQSTISSMSPADNIACNNPTVLRTDTVGNSGESRTGVVFDPRMCLHKSAKFPHHEECPERILDVYNALNACGLWDQFVHIPSRAATPEELALAHNKAHCKDMAKLSKASHRANREEELWSDSVYCNEHTYFAATLSAGSLLSLVDSICSDENRVNNDIALIRPPDTTPNTTKLWVLYIQQLRCGGKVRATKVRLRTHFDSRLGYSPWQWYSEHFYRRSFCALFLCTSV